MAFFDKMKEGLAKSRTKLRDSMNVLLAKGPDVDDDFWDSLEETLIESDMGAQAAMDIIEELRGEATRKALPDADAVLDLLAGKIAARFTVPESPLLESNPLCVLFVGINGAGKTTTTGKLAAEAKSHGRKVILGAADTFRAAAIEQLEEWAKRSDVPIIERERGSDPASVCYETLDAAQRQQADLVLIDTAGRLHTSDDLMRELKKICDVVRKRADMPVATILVVDATTGQNGLAQARRFNDALSLDGVIITKLDGTAKGGIAVAISYELGLPIVKAGIGEGIEDLRDFDALEFSRALIEEGE